MRKLILIILFILILGIIGKAEQKQEQKDRQFYINTYNFDYTLNN